MLLQPLRLYLILQAISSAFGRLEIKNSSSYGTSSTLGADLKATPSSTSINGLSTTDALGFNASSTMSSSLLHHENLTAEDNAGYPHARNDGSDVRITGADTYELELRNGKLDFDLCQASACNGRILACFESDTPTFSWTNNPRMLCTEVSDSPCGFQADISPQDVYLMGKTLVSLKQFFTAQQCQVSLTSLKLIIGEHPYDSCIPKISGNSVKLIVQAASGSCPLIVKGAQLKPKELSTTATIKANNSTTEDSSSATTIWVVVSCLIFAFALLGLVLFAIWFFKLRHRKAKPAKAQPAKVADSTDKVQTQVQVKDEIKNGDALGKKDLVPVKSESKVVVDTPAKPEEPAKVKSESKVAAETPAKPVEAAKVKAAEVVHAELKTTEDTAGDSTVPPTVPAAPVVDPAVKNEQLVARAKSAMKTFSLRSGKSAKSGQKKPDSALLRLQASNEYRKVAPIHSLSRVYGIYADTAKDTARLYPPGCLYPDACVKTLLLGPADFALEFCNHLAADAHQTLVDHGVEFDTSKNTIKIPEQARKMVRERKTEEHIKAYLFLAEHGKDFNPTPAILSKLSAPLLFVIAVGTRYSDQLREAAIVEMRRHLPFIQKCWSYEERLKCHFPINGIEQAHKLNKRLLQKNADLDSESSSGRKAALERQKQRKTSERADKREKRR